MSENMNSIIEARLIAAVAAEARLTALAAQFAEALGDLRNQVSGAQLAHMRVYEAPPHRRATDHPRCTEPLTFEAADKVDASPWPPADAVDLRRDNGRAR